MAVKQQEQPREGGMFSIERSEFDRLQVRLLHSVWSRVCTVPRGDVANYM